MTRFQDASLPGCGELKLCWHDNKTDQCTREQPEQYTVEVLFLKIESTDALKRGYFALNVPMNLSRTIASDGQETITYHETYPKPMPPGPGSDAGFKSRFTLTMTVELDQIVELVIYQEDFDARTKTWEPWFDIRYTLDNPIICK